MAKADMIGRIREVLSTVRAVKIAYLYGSFLSRDDFRDIDIALLLDELHLPDDRMSVAGEAGLALEEVLGFSYNCDIRILNDAPVWFAFEVISTGHPVFARSDEVRFEFETDVVIAYLDMKYTYDLFDREYLAQA